MLIAPELLWLDGALRAELAFELSPDGRCLGAPRALGADTPDLRPHLVMPACTDLQVNGGGGVMVNSDPTADGLHRMAAAHRKLGTGAILPTVITDAPEVMEAAAEAAIAVKGAPGQLGLHIEGPHIAAARRGTHAERFIRPLDRRTLDCLTRLRTAGVPVLLTLAPEEADPALMAEARALGVVLSAGHSAATAEQARQGMAHGVTMFTHLFNAMPPLLSRDPGIVGAAILSDAWCGIIADGIHVSWEALRIAIAARPRRDRMVIVSDAMATVGGPESFTLYGQTIREENGALVNSEGALAGAHIDMVTSLANLHHHAGLSLGDVITMATTAPRAALGLPPPESLRPGSDIADFIALKDDLTVLPWPI